MNERALDFFNEVKKSLVGKDETVKKCVIAVIGGGHILLEDIPGVGKTTLSKAIAAAAGLKTKRIQFTPDTMPSDITGFTMWDPGSGELRFHKGAVMTDILLADEINRASPRAQSALLQAMEERAVSEEGKTYPLSELFTVIATQNPFGSAGTMPLPPSQLDRFMMKLSLGRPNEKELAELIYSRADEGEYTPRAVCGEAEMAEMRKKAAETAVSKPIAEWSARLIEKTHGAEGVQRGASPRAALSLISAAKASAYFEGRAAVLPEDIAFLFSDCIAHRMITEQSAAEICANILQDNPPPHIRARRT